jgi:hypothetical protein
MNTTAEIEEAVRRLSRGERRRLFDWFAGVLDGEPGVSEPVVKYGSAAERREFFTIEEYFEMEERSAILHEYVAGEIYDMADPSLDHDLITLNLAAPLHAHVQDRGCRVFTGADSSSSRLAGRISSTVQMFGWRAERFETQREGVSMSRAW